MALPSSDHWNIHQDGRGNTPTNLLDPACILTHPHAHAPSVLQTPCGALSGASTRWNRGPYQVVIFSEPPSSPKAPKSSSGESTIRNNLQMPPRLLPRPLTRWLRKQPRRLLRPSKARRRRPTRRHERRTTPLTSTKVCRTHLACWMRSNSAI
jgi:hypothetical protein